MKYKVMDFNQNSSFQFRGFSSSISNSFHSNISACNLLRNYHYFIDAPNISREFSIKPFISEPSSSTNITEKNTKNYELNNFGLTNHRDRKFHHFLPKEVVFNQNHHQLLSAYPHSLPLLQNSDSFGTTLSSSASVEIPNLSPKNRKHRSEKRPIPEAQKDVKYFERRRRNNHAAKKSRDARKLREDQIALRATILEHENALLRAQVITLREETTTLRNILLHSRNNNNNNNNNKSFAELSTTEVPVCVITQ